jgi:hypothetical protein|tara:strand:+ start:79 stop:246 length:168 start_codon:yes stop_codon:yes gene_type:complete
MNKFTKAIPPGDTDDSRKKAVHFKKRKQRKLDHNINFKNIRSIHDIDEDADEYNL